MKKIVMLFSIIIMAGIIQAEPVNWKFDGSHSKIGFAVSHMMISDVEGYFGIYNGTVKTQGQDFFTAKIEFEIDVNSVNTANEKRDAHLRNEDFFHIEKFPKIMFKSTKMEKVGEKQYKMTGDFTMMGVTKSITLDVTHNGTLNDPWGNTRAGFKIIGIIDRTLWGLKYNSVMDTGGLMIGEEVHISGKIELIKQK